MLAAREGEAPLEAEDLHAVRLMTIHAAKGLEFPVVCVADLGRSGRGDDDALRVTDDGRVGLKIASMAGGSAKGLDLEAIEDEQEREQDEEERRIFYVAMTRAQELLVLSGATDTEKWPAPRPLGVPMNWIWRGFAPGLDAGEPQGARSTVCTPENVDDLLDASARYGGPLVGEDASVPVAPLQGVRAASRPRPRCRWGGSRTPASRATARAATGSTSSGSSGCASSSRLPGDESQPEPPGSDELSPLLRGTVVHELLERLDFAEPVAPAPEDVAERLGSYGADAGAAAVEDTRRFVTAFLGSPTARARSRRRSACARSWRSPTSSRRPRPGGGACSSTASWTCTPRSRTVC